MKSAKRVLNWRPDLPDWRDHEFMKPIEVPINLPQRVDLRPFCSFVEDQGALGSCTGNAIAGAIELLQIKMKKPQTEISRLFIYYNERKYIGTITEDSGAYIRDGIKSIRKIGAADELIWPYMISKFKEKPSAEAYKDAASRKFSSYERISWRSNVKDALAAGYPVTFGFSVYSSFMSSQVARTGIMPMPKKGETLEGGHAVLAVGYSMASKRYIIRNSWGAGWGQKGYFTMPMQYLENPDLTDDFWVIKG